MREYREQFEALGVELLAHMDDLLMALRELTEETLRAIPFLVQELARIGVQINYAKTKAVPPMNHASTEREVAALAAVGITATDNGGAVVGTPIGTDAFVQQHAVNVVNDKGADDLTRLLARMLDKQAAMLIAKKSRALKTCFLEGVMDAELSEQAWERADDGGLWMSEKVMELPHTADAQEFFETGCAPICLKLLPYQELQAGCPLDRGGWASPQPGAGSDRLR